VPGYFDSLQSLEEVHFVSNAELNLENLFLRLSKLPKLTILKIYDNKLVYVPKTIGDFESLQFLDIGSNNISFLPNLFY